MFMNEPQLKVVSNYFQIEKIHKSVMLDGPPIENEDTEETEDERVDKHGIRMHSKHTNFQDKMNLVIKSLQMNQLEL